MKAATVLRSIFERETSGRVSPHSFVGSIFLRFPANVTEALVCSEVNLQKAPPQLARLYIGARLKWTPDQMRCTFQDVL